MSSGDMAAIYRRRVNYPSGRSLYRMARGFGLASWAVLALAGCGDGEKAASRTAPSEVTPVPTASAAVPTATAEIHASPSPAATPTATATPETGGAEAGEGGGSETGGAGAGDEAGIDQSLQVLVTEDRVRLIPSQVTAFLPFRLRVRNLRRSATTVVLMLADGDRAARVQVEPGEGDDAKVKGLQPGTAEVLSPDLGPDASAKLTIKRGG